MLQAMVTAEVGDDVMGEDPTVNELQRVAAQAFGHEAALFCPSGTQTNQIAIKVHTQPGDELLCSDTAHVFCWEGGGIAMNSGVQARTLPGDEAGRISAKQVAAAVQPEDVHLPRTTLVCLENTTNKGGGALYSLQAMQEIAQVARAHGLRCHLDGARLYNAFIASGDRSCCCLPLARTAAGEGAAANGPSAAAANGPTANGGTPYAAAPKGDGSGAEGGHAEEAVTAAAASSPCAPYGPMDVGKCFDSISICLSKGLGAPVGSLLTGSHAFIAQARRVRKVMGGGMRQAGFLAAAGLFALQHNVARLAEDHARAHQLSAVLAGLDPRFCARVAPCPTNIVIWELAEPHSTQEIKEALAAEGVLISTMGGRSMRFVTHLDVSQEHVEAAITALFEVQAQALGALKCS